MNKAELIDVVAERAGLSRSDAGRALEAALGAIERALRKGDKVALPGFGTFAVRGHAARAGRNPRTGAPIRIAAGRRAAFKAGKALRDSVN